MREKVVHPFDAIYNKDSKILFLGSVASIKSRQLGYPYASPQNRFWKVMRVLFDEEITDIKSFLLRHNIALWDVIKSCDIVGSSDASIRNVVVNEIWDVIEDSNITKVFTNGKKSYELYQKYVFEKTKIEAVSLPSTSPANATKRLDDLVEDYKIIKAYL